VSWLEKIHVQIDQEKAVRKKKRKKRKGLFKEKEDQSCIE
jgi:hypothetical protein